MKKVLIIVLSCILSIFIATSIKLEIIHTSNINIQKNIDSANKDNDNIKQDNLKYEDEITKLKEENKEKWESVESWTKTKERIQEALS